MRSASSCQKLRRCLLPVALVCLLVALVSFSGCITKLPGLSGISLPGIGSLGGTTTTPASDTVQDQGNQTQGTGTAGVQGAGDPCAAGGPGLTPFDDGYCYCGTKGNSCLPGQTCINGQCSGGSGASAGQGGSGGTSTEQEDSGGALHCPEGYESYTVCGQNCYDLTSNPYHCGSCDNACPEGQACTSSQCVGTTAQTSGDSGSQGVCSGQTVDLMTDNVNCGTCGKVCDGCKPCQQGTCQNKVGVCDYCTKNSDCVGDRFPTPPEFTAAHFVWKCLQNACKPDCQTGYTLCGPLNCINTQTDAGNCGACTNKCPSGQSCVSGKCTGSPSYATCASGTTMCNGVCKNLKTDAGNCGSCGHACSSGICSAGVCVDCNTASDCMAPLPANMDWTACSSHKCVRTCNSGYGNCDGNIQNGCEANLMTSTSNCGSCGTKCPTNGGYCSSGTCHCPTGYVNSNGACSAIMIKQPVVRPSIIIRPDIVDPGILDNLAH